MLQQKVVIVGGGFGGLAAARALRRYPFEVVLIDRTNHHLFQPLLYEVATAGLAPSEITAPIRQVLQSLPNVEVVMAEVTGIDMGTRSVRTDRGGYSYDYLVLATGSCYNYFGHEAWEKYAPSLKTISDAVLIRQRILLAFEQAELETDPRRRARLLTFVLIGAGPTGVEMAGAIAELSHKALAGNFRKIDPASARILLLEAGPRILAAFPETLARKAREALNRLGVEVSTGEMVSNILDDGVIINGELIESATVVWTAGVKASALVAELNVETDRSGKVKTKPDLSVSGHPEVFVIGDSCFFEQDGKPLPGLAPVAMQQGHYVASVIGAQSLGSASSKPFRYRDKGNLATVGRSYGIADFNSIRASGLFAWVLWLVVHIYFLIGFHNRFAVILEWAWAYFTYDRGARLIIDGDKAMQRIAAK